jgi:hypothetical protein
VDGASSAHPRNNVIKYLAGDVYADASTHGNTISNWTGEEGQVFIETGGQINYTVHDNAAGGLYQTPTLKLKEDKMVHLGDMAIIPGGVTDAARGSMGARRFPTIDFGATNEEVVGFYLTPPYDWSGGSITGVRFYYSSSAAGTSNNVVVETLITCQPALAAGTPFSPDKTENVTLPVNDTASYLHVNTQTFAAAQAFGNADSIGVRLTRKPGDASDDYAGNWQLMGCEVLFEADGPESGTSGPWPIGGLGKN